MLKYNNVYCDDALKGLKKLPSSSVHAVITDPPYGIGHIYADGKEKHDDPDLYWGWLKPIYKEMLRVLKPGGFFAMWQTQKYFPHFWRWFGEDIHIYIGCKNFVQIRRNDITYAYDPIISFYKEGKKRLEAPTPRITRDWFMGNTARFGLNRDPWAKKHPNARPLDQCISLAKNFTCKNAIILDPFCGAGTIPIAAILTDRRYIGFDSCEEYVGLAQDRINNLEEVKKIYGDSLLNIK